MHIPFTLPFVPVTLARIILLAAATPVAGLAVFVAFEAGFMELLFLNRVPITIAVCFLFAACVRAMRNPWDGWYNWFYRVTHSVTGGHDGSDDAQAWAKTLKER